MGLVAKSNDEHVLQEATKIVAGLEKPDEIERVTVRIGPDHQGEESLWFRLVLKRDAADTAESVRHLSAFSRLITNKVFENEIGLFPYTYIESPE